MTDELDCIRNQSHSPQPLGWGPRGTQSQKPFQMVFISRPKCCPANETIETVLRHSMSSIPNLKVGVNETTYQ